MRTKKVYIYSVLFFMAVTNILFTNCSSNKYLSQSSTQAGSQTAAATEPSESTPTVPGVTPPVVVTPPIVVTPPVVVNPPVGQVPVVVALGHMGRTLLSCDGGVSWRHDQSDRDSARCWIDNDPNFVECDHTASSARSLVYGDGYFYTKFGWGSPGTVRRTSDGINWSVVVQESATREIGDIGLARGILSMNAGDTGAQVSRDRGINWQTLNLRFDLDHPTTYVVNDKVIILGRTKGLVVSLDGGLTWGAQVNPFPTSGTIYHRKSDQFAEGNGVLVTTYGLMTDALNPLYAAVSRDNGATWTTRLVHEQRWGEWQQLIFDGQNFVSWTENRIWKSADGLNWTSEAMPQFDFLRGAIHFDRVSRNYIMIRGSYLNQFAYTSRDGKTWTQVTSAAFKGGHPVYKIVEGYLPRSTCGL